MSASSRSALMLGLLLAACQDPTQVRVMVSTDGLACGPGEQMVHSTAFASAPASDQAPTDVVLTDRCEARGEGASIGDLVYVPSGDDASSFSLEVYLGLGDKSAEACQRECGTDCIEARRRVSFVPQQSLLMPIVFEPSCIGRCCPDGQTCVGGQCTSEVIDPCADGEGSGCNDDPPAPHELVAVRSAGGADVWLVGTRTGDTSIEGFVQLRREGDAPATVSCVAGAGDVRFRAAAARGDQLLVAGDAEGTLTCGPDVNGMAVAADLPERASFMLEVRADGQLASAPVVLAHHALGNGSQLRAADVVARANDSIDVLFRMDGPVIVDTASPVTLSETGGLVVEMEGSRVVGHLPIDAKGGMPTLLGTEVDGTLMLAGTTGGSLTVGSAVLSSSEPQAFILVPDAVSPTAIVAHHQITNGGAALRVNGLSRARDFGAILALTHAAGVITGVELLGGVETDSCSVLAVSVQQGALTVLRGHTEPDCVDVVPPRGEVPDSIFSQSTALLAGGRWKLGWPQTQGFAGGITLAARPMLATPTPDRRLVVAGALGPNEVLGATGASLCEGDESDIFVLPGNPTPFVACLASP